MSKPSVKNTKQVNQNTKSRVRAGMTNRMGTKTRKYGGGTYGNTTTSKSGSREQEGWVIDDNGKEINVKPDSLLKRRGAGGEKGGDKTQNDLSTYGDATRTVAKDDSESVGLQKQEESKKETTDKMKSGMETGTGMQTSQSMLSSMLEGSEDEESKKKHDAKKKSKDEKKGLTEAEKNKMVDIEL